MQNKLDVIIIGAGPIGLTCGIEAEKRGSGYLIIEKGCLVNSIFHYPTNMTFFSTSEKIEIGNVPFVSHGDKPTRREALEYFRRVRESWNLNIHTYEKVLSVDGSAGDFSVKTDKDIYKAKKIIIATGFYDKPNLMNVPGEGLPKVKHYFNEAHPYAYQKVAVAGAGNSAVDVALETFRRGSEVTMVIRGDRLKDSVKYWVKPDIENRIKEGSIKAYFNSIITAIGEKEIDIQTPEEKITLENDFVLAMTGYHTDFDFLDSCGVAYAKDDFKVPSINSETFETNMQGIYMAGVVLCGVETGKWFIENSLHHAENIFNDIERKEAKVPSNTDN